MKKIQRLSLNGLEETCTLLNDSVQASILGGGEDRKIKGGLLQEVNGGVQYTGDDGKTCFFSGVSLGTCSASGTANQFCGIINISKDWTNFDVNHFAHEYGHYLQQEEMGLLGYFGSVAFPSAVDIVWGSILDRLGISHTDHSNLECEQDATKRGDDYLKKNMKSSDSDK